MEKLKQAVAVAARPESWGNCAAACFQLMYALPWQVQLATARLMTLRYLPIFEAKQPDEPWARQLIDDVAGWHARHERAVPDPAGPLDMADTAFQFCFDSLLYAYHYRSDSASLAASVCCVISHAVHSRGLNVWVADDPEGVLLNAKAMEIGRTGVEYPQSGPFSSERLFAPEHQAHNNAAYVAVARREWATLVDWLDAEQVSQHPEPEDPSAIMEALKRWEEHDQLLMRPKDMENTSPLD
ncbi:hypothetical protein WME91_12125 [Sorangium sp. So ce269]